MSLRKTVLIWVLAGVFLAPAARADVILNSSVSGTSGNYSYAYQLENQTSVGILLLSLTVTGDVRLVQAPTGWVSATNLLAPGETQVEWVSTDVPYDVPALGALSGFVIASDSGPGSVAFSTFDENFSEFDGRTVGPVAATSVPEPGSLILIGTALIGITLSQLLGKRCRRLT